MNQNTAPTPTNPIPQSPTPPHTTAKIKLLPLILITLFGFALFFALSLLLDQILDLESLSYEVMIFVSTLLNFIAFSAIFFLFGILTKKLSLTSVGLITQKFQWWWLLLIPAIVIASLPVRSIVGTLIELIFNGDFSSLELRTDLLMPESFTLVTFFIAWFGIGILAPIGEELFFRGFIHTALIDHAPFWLRTIISAIIFSFGHFDSIGVMATSFIMGLILAIAYEKSQSLWFAIGIHIVNNSISIFLIYALLLLQEITGTPLL